MRSDITSLPWTQRLQCMHTLNIDDQTAADMFGITIDEVLEAKQQYTADSTFDPSPYITTSEPAGDNTPVPAGSIITATTPTAKRGRPSNRIREAFDAVTETPTVLTEFCEQHNVSIHVMKQVSRFAPDLVNTIVVRKRAGVYQIWRTDDTSPHSNSTSTDQ